MTGRIDAGRIRIRLPDWAYALARLLFCDRTNGLPVVAVDVVPEDTVGIEGDAPRVVRAARIEGRRPVAAVGPGIAKVRAEPAACGWKEDAVSVNFTSYPVAIHAVLSRPRPSAFVT